MPDTVLNSKGTKINRTWFLASKCSWYNKTMNQFLKTLYSHILNFGLKWINVLYLSKKLWWTSLFESPSCVCLSSQSSHWISTRTTAYFYRQHPEETLYLDGVHASFFSLFCLHPLHRSKFLWLSLYFCLMNPISIFYREWLLVKDSLNYCLFKIVFKILK